MRFDTIVRGPSVLTAALGLCLTSPGPALADGGGGGGNSDKTTCPRGEVYDARSMSCVKQGGSVLPDKALNYRGYATRKLGRVDEGIGYYKKSVALDPRYAKVREYLGEAYVIKGDTAHARGQLAVIKTICGTGCEEYTHLAQAIT